MKRYFKEINGKKVYKTRQQIVVNKDGFNVYNPTEEMILADGWTELVTPEPSEEELFNRALNHKKEDIKRHDSSSEVNEFTVQGQPVWLDKQTRTGLMLRFQSEQAMGMTETSLWYEGMQFPLHIDMAIQMLYAIEIYASKCYDNTALHLSNVSKLSSIEEIENYDYRTGYPDKLMF